MEARLYGLTTQDISTVVYRFCEQYNISHKFSREKQMAGKKWFQAFLRRHGELSVRMPEKTSMCRASGFNIAKTSKFFQYLRQRCSAAMAAENTTRTDIQRRWNGIHCLSEGTKNCWAKEKEGSRCTLQCRERKKHYSGVLCFSIWFLRAAHVYLSTSSSSKRIPWPWASWSYCSRQ